MAICGSTRLDDPECRDHMCDDGCIHSNNNYGEQPCTSCMSSRDFICGFEIRTSEEPEDEDDC